MAAPSDRGRGRSQGTPGGAAAGSIDAAVQRRIDEAHERARAVLRENRAALDAIAEALVREESLDREELTAIINAPTPPGTERLPHAQRAHVL